MCTPSTSIFACPIPPLDLMNETSYFSDDEDEEPRSAKLAKVFQIRRGSRDSEGSSPTKETASSDKDRPRTQRLRKSIEDVNETLKSVFRIKK
jgi:hypothetical protein